MAHATLIGTAELAAHLDDPACVAFNCRHDLAQPDAVVHSCGSGVSACHNLLAMEIAGLCGSRLYPGSWSEWCSDPGRPIEQG